ncbi:MAG: AAA family ATPase, partial [Magnetococcales bacterium]|nr:AAA family ATPase [Magnetococcales bacterium]
QSNFGSNSSGFRPERQGSSPTPEEITSALHTISPDCDREQWVQAGMAIKAELGDSGFAVFDGWSRGGKSYQQTDCRDTWKSIKPGGGTTIKTLFKMAHDAGWQWTPPPRTGTQNGPSPGRHGHTTPKHDPEAIWAACLQEILEHTYLRKKAVHAFGLRLYQGPIVIAGMPCDGALAMLLVDGTGKAMTIQFISATGEKRFLPGCPKKGAFHVIGTLTEIIIVCEGCATGSTIHMATGYRVIVAVDSGNLLTVTQTIRAMHPHHTIILAADDDRHLPGNPGLEKAIESAAAIGGYLATPDFGTNRPEGATDFNDLSAFLGLEAVRAQLAGAKRVEAEAAAQTSSKFPQTGFDLTQLLSMSFPDPRWAIPGVLPEGVAVLGGAPKIGKSWLAMHIHLMVAKGGMVLGKILVARGESLYLALEDNPRRLRSRCEKLLANMPGPPPVGAYFFNEWARFDQGGIESLDAWLSEHPDCRLVIVDTLAKVRPARSKGGDVYGDDYRVGEILKPLADQYRVCILIVHHLRKMTSEDPLETLSGSMGLAGGMDGILVLKRPRGKTDVTLFVTGRDIEEEKSHALKWTPETCTWELLGDAAVLAHTEEQRAVITQFRRRVVP